MNSEGGFTPLPKPPPENRMAPAEPALERRPTKPVPRTRKHSGPASPSVEPEVILYTDGACSGNPGPGGWAALIIDGGEERVVSGAEAATTNQRMELRAALEGLAALPGRRRVRLHSDSAYVVNCFLDGWWQGWEQRGWVGASKQPIANRDLWERLLAESRRQEVTWVKVAGHAGDPLNERVDRLARAAIASLPARS